MKEKIIDNLGVIVAIGLFIFLIVCFIQGLRENWFWWLILVCYVITYKLINKEYDTIKLLGKDLEKIHIIGQIVGIMRDSR